MWCRSALIAALVAGSAGCKRTERSPVDFGTPRTFSVQPCQPGSGAPEPSGRTIRIALHTGQGVSAEQLAVHTRALAGYLKESGIGLEIVSETAAPVAARYGFLGRMELGTRRAEPAEAATGFARPLAQFLAGRPRQAPGVIDVVLLERVASPSSAVAVQLDSLAGLAISEDLATGLGLPGVAGRPVILLSARDSADLHEMMRDTTLAHELGHVFGLSHVPDPANLMALQRATDCRPVLVPSQLATIADSLNLRPATNAQGPADH